MNWKHRTKFRNRFITPLMAKGLIEMTIPDKPNSRLQRYKVTQKGLEQLSQLQLEVKADGKKAR